MLGVRQVRHAVRLAAKRSDGWVITPDRSGDIIGYQAFLLASYRSGPSQHRVSADACRSMSMPRATRHSGSPAVYCRSHLGRREKLFRNTCPHSLVRRGGEGEGAGPEGLWISRRRLASQQDIATNPMRIHPSGDSFRILKCCVCANSIPGRVYRAQRVLCEQKFMHPRICPTY